tara:strand:- start:484 stop:651 length:168 start_codon:yes stop_codon:yes gene_type:complete
MKKIFVIVLLGLLASITDSHSKSKQELWRMVIRIIKKISDQLREIFFQKEPNNQK